MEKILKHGLLAAALIASAACSKWNEPRPLELQKPIVKDDAYYENLRAYKRSDHQVAFGWYGGWKGSGPSMKSVMSSVPDSVDIISLWGRVSEMNDELRADLDFVQRVKGTKVIACILLGGLGKGLDNDDTVWPPVKKKPTNPESESYEADMKAYNEYLDGLRLYAGKLVEQYDRDGFDGMDIDFEPRGGGVTDVGGCPTGDEFTVLVEALGKHYGPKSGSGKLLCIDGELGLCPAEAAPYFDYAIAQAYYTTRPSSLQSRFNAIQDRFKPHQFIVTEDFERSWSTGGYPYVDPVYGAVPSLIGMAHWNPTQGAKGGCGSYHMEYEYNLPDMDYKYLRRAIQIMNPAVL